MRRTLFTITTLWMLGCSGMTGGGEGAPVSQTSAQGSDATGAQAPAVGDPAAAPRLNVTVRYSGGKSFQLLNLSSGAYTGLTLVANSDYRYELKKLPPGGNDSVRLSTFVSVKDGSNLRPPMTSLWITSDQGEWSSTF